MPDPDGAEALFDGPGLDTGSLRNRAIVIGNVDALSRGIELPSVVGAANGIPFDVGSMAINEHIRGRVIRQVRAHVRAVGIHQNGLARCLATKEHHVLSKVPNRNRLVRIDGLARCDHEPPPGEGKVAKLVVFCRCHVVSSLKRISQGSQVVWLRDRA